MEDREIVELYWARSETAISETEKKYGKYCHSVAGRILSSAEDAEECVNDAYLAAWESIPPQKPERLSVYLGKLTRNLSINRYVRNTAAKRSATVDAVFDEIAECIPDPDTEGDRTDEIVLREAINAFLGSLSKRDRVVFVKRYWYVEPIAAVARETALTESNVKVILSRTRNKFRKYLEKEGVTI